MSSFLVIQHPRGQFESIPVGMIVRVEWNPTPDGCDGSLLLRLTNGDVRCVPFSHPGLPAAAEAVGLKEVYSSWPKAKADAEAKRKKAKEDRDVAKARQLAARGVRV
jgi:hypothetical protein